MGPRGAKFLGPVVLEVPHFASLRGREREIVILRSDDGQRWAEHQVGAQSRLKTSLCDGGEQTRIDLQLEATEDAVQEVLNESFDAAELQLDDLNSTRITRILTNDFPMYFAVITRVRQEVHCVGPEGGVILSSVVSRVQAIFPVKDCWRFIGGKYTRSKKLGVYFIVKALRRLTRNFDCKLRQPRKYKL